MRNARSMVRTLTLRVVTLVAVAVITLGAAGIWGLRIITDLIAERELSIAAQAVASWGGGDASDRSISGDRLRSLDPAATVVALVDDDTVVVVAADPGETPVEPLRQLAADLGPGEVRAADIAGRSFLVTEVTFPTGTVYRTDVDRTAVSGAIVGIATGAADRLLRALTLFVLATLAVTLAGAAVAVARVVRRTTRSLTTLADRVEDNDLEDLGGSLEGDFSETRNIAVAIVRLDERRSRTERELRDFIADASHELRTPLTKIQGWSELHFQDAADASRTEQAFESIVEESQRMRGLIDQLTQLARAESSSAPEHSVVDLAALAAHVVDDVALLTDDRHVSFAATGRPLVKGDAQELTQLIRNLVGNAIVHGGPESRVQVTATEAAGRVVLVVADDGRGIAPGLQEKAFDRFVTGNRAVGTGLGLAIVRAIATSHGAAVDLTSAPGAGTRVAITFPPAGADGTDGSAA